MWQRNYVPEHLKDTYKEEINDMTPEVLKNSNGWHYYLIPIGGDDTLSYGVASLQTRSEGCGHFPRHMDN